MPCVKKDLPLMGEAIVDQQFVQTQLEMKISSAVPTIPSERLARAKAAYATRRIVFPHMTTLVAGDTVPHSGDVVIARVETVGQHPQIELSNGRRANLFVGDEVIVCYGNRYAPDHFEAVVPGDLGECHLVAGGGVAARLLSTHGTTSSPTVLKPLGLLGDSFGQRINLADWGLPKLSHDASCGIRPLTIAVVGSTMNVGKTAAAANLVRGMVNAGMRVGAVKVTGAGTGGDTWVMRDAGADPVLDFTDAGLASTYLVGIDQIIESMATLMGHLCAARVDAIVLEVADGIYQGETAGLLSSAYFCTTVDSVLFAAGDAMGAAAGVAWLEQHQLPVLGLTGILTLSPLAIGEAYRVTGLPVLDVQMLRDPEIAGRTGHHAG